MKDTVNAREQVSGALVELRQHIDEFTVTETERRKVEEELREERDRVHRCFDAADVILVAIDAGGKVS